MTDERERNEEWERMRESAGESADELAADERAMNEGRARFTGSGGERAVDPADDPSDAGEAVGEDEAAERAAPPSV